MKPFLLVIEGPETVDAEVLERIASEGRKSGVSTCLLSQHPSSMSSRVLSQMGFHFIGRTTDAVDIECLKNSVGDKIPLLPHLAKGEWIVSGINVRPTKAFVRDRYSLNV